MAKAYSSNPSIQCSVCGQWKRLTRMTGEEIGMQTFYPVCDDDTEHKYRYSMANIFRYKPDNLSKVDYEVKIKGEDVDISELPGFNDYC